MDEDPVDQIYEQCKELKTGQIVLLTQKLNDHGDLYPLEWLSLTNSVLRPEYFERYRWIKERFVSVNMELKGVTIAAEPTNKTDEELKAFTNAMIILGGPQNMSLNINMVGGKFSMLLSHVLSFDNFWNDLTRMLEEYKEKN